MDETSPSKRTGLLDAMGYGDSPFAGWLNDRRYTLMSIGQGMIGHDSARDAMRGSAQGAFEGAKFQSAYNRLRDEQNRNQQTVINAANKMREYGYSEYADAVETGGMDLNSAWNGILKVMSPSQPQLTADQRNFQMAQNDPAFAEFMGIGAGPEPTDTQRNLEWRAAQSGLQPGTPEYQQFMMSGGSGGTSLSVGPDGSVSFQQGGSNRAPTEGQSKDAVFATRAAGALEILNPIAGELTNPIARGVEGDPTGIARGALQSPQYQQANQAGLEFLQAILRKDTGAAITPAESQEYGRVYLDQPGDSPQVQAQKKLSRLRALEALKAGMAPQAILNMEQALLNAGGPDDPLGLR